MSLRNHYDEKALTDIKVSEANISKAIDQVKENSAPAGIPAIFFLFFVQKALVHVKVETRCNSTSPKMSPQRNDSHI